MEKKCPSCELIKNVSEFAKNSSKSDGLQTHCRECKKKYDHQHYKNFTEEQKKRVKTNSKKYLTILSSKINELKSQSGCIKCNENDFRCLDFHHKNPEEKTDTIARLIRNTWSLEVVLKEIEKCEVLCANCHRKHHYGSLV